MGTFDNHESEKVLKRKRKIKKIRIFITTFIISIITMGLIGFVIIFHSPYTALKEVFVESAMTTLEHQWLARLFVSDEEIKSIMEKNKIKEPQENTEEKDITPISEKSNEMKLISIKRPLFKGYLLLVKDPSRVSVAVTENLGGQGMLVTELVKKHGATAGINAGGFADENGKGTGGRPSGILIEDGKIIQMDKSTKHTVIGFDKNNVLVLGQYSAKEIKEMGIRDAVSFKPFIIVNGKPMITEGDGGWGIAPRTAIGQKKDGTVLMLVIDGRQPQKGSIGATLKDVQDIMLKYGAHNATNLDGGSSSTLVNDGEIINSPSSQYGPRYVPSAFIVK